MPSLEFTLKPVKDKGVIVAYDELDRELTIDEIWAYLNWMFIEGTIIRYKIFDRGKKIVDVNSLITLQKGDSRLEG